MPSPDNDVYRQPGQPLTKVRSKWVQTDPITIGGIQEATYRRLVNDGRLAVIVGLEPAGWHLSISFMDNRNRPSRYPRWDEIAEARYRFVPNDVTMAMILPPPGEYVAIHDTTFHLHQIDGAIHE
jgi:hypothetical protein